MLSSDKMGDITKTAALAALAVVLSYVEAISGIDALMPVPGIKLGFANIAVTVAAYNVSLKSGFGVSLIRVCVIALLFGSPVTFLYSLGGAICAYAFVVISKLVFKDSVSLTGVSIGSSALHMTGQLVVACLILSDDAILNMLPIYLIVSVIPGLVTGVISTMVSQMLVHGKNR